MIRTGGSPNPASSARVRAGRRILVVDDVRFFRARIRQLLGQLGYWRVVEAGSGREAIALVRANRFDLAVLDVALEDADGISVLRAMRRLDPRMRVVVVTAAASEPVVRQARAAGAARVYVKPIDDEAFKSELLALVEGDGELS